jgi:hypothetical protein
LPLMAEVNKWTFLTDVLQFHKCICQFVKFQDYFDQYSQCWRSICLFIQIFIKLLILNTIKSKAPKLLWMCMNWGNPFTHLPCSNETSFSDLYIANSQNTIQWKWDGENIKQIIEVITRTVLDPIWVYFQKTKRIL